MPMDVALGTSLPPSAHSVSQYASDLRQSPDVSYAHVRQQMGHELEKQKMHHDAKIQGQPFNTGDLVWLHNPAVPRGKSKKLHRPWTGPFRVVKRLAEAVYRLQHVHGHRRRPVVHYNRLKPCLPPPPPHYPAGPSQQTAGKQWSVAIRPISPSSRGWSAASG